jgi:hypothetical protein
MKYLQLTKLLLLGIIIWNLAIFKRTSMYELLKSIGFKFYKWGRNSCLWEWNSTVLCHICFWDTALEHHVMDLNRYGGSINTVEYTVDQLYVSFIPLHVLAWLAIVQLILHSLFTWLLLIHIGCIYSQSRYKQLNDFIEELYCFVAFLFTG